MNHEVAEEPEEDEHEILVSEAIAALCRLKISVTYDPEDAESVGDGIQEIEAQIDVVLAPYLHVSRVVEMALQLKSACRDTILLRFATDPVRAAPPLLH